MAVTFFFDMAGRQIIQVDDNPSAPQNPPPPSPPPKKPKIVIGNGPGAQTLMVRFESSNNLISIANLKLNPAIAVDDSIASTAFSTIVTRIHNSLAAGGSGSHRVDLEWSFANEFSLTELADALTIGLSFPVTIELPGIAKVTGTK